ncbi:hypothetical protein [Sphingorhabdus sp.]|jgi:hypothetical protein|uniref:hypothetical protein n=1 Tax=Sphingorhabdus sp. TaxID=1902408 RepID=UPI00378364F8
MKFSSPTWADFPRSFSIKLLAVNDDNLLAIGERFAADALHLFNRPQHVLKAGGSAIAAAKIEFCRITLQVFLAAKLLLAANRNFRLCPTLTK